MERTRLRKIAALAWLPAGVVLSCMALAPAAAAQDPATFRLPAAATTEAQAAESAADPANAAAEPPAPAYRSHAAMVALVDAWAAGVEGWTIERASLGYSHSGLELPLLVFGRAGALELARRPTVLLIGGLDGVSLSGSEAVLAAVAEVLAAAPADVTFAALPWGSPDGLTSWVEGRGGPGVNGAPNDSDNDGRRDEDGPDDADGDGAILDMLIPDPLGPWARDDDGRRLRPAGVLDAERFLLAREGVDDDGDGRFNEDGIGGVDLDRGFPLGWRGVWDGVPGGPWPLSEPSARSLAFFVTSRNVATALLFQGSHGQCAAPGGRASTDAGEGLGLRELGGVAPVDRPVFEALTRLFHGATGRQGPLFTPLHVARAEERSGAALDWLYGAAGVAAVEVAMWGPPRPAGSAGGRTPAFARIDVPGDERALRAAVDDAWFRWSDNDHGGYLFQPWAPFDLGGGSLAWIGGWRSRTRMNPPAERLPEALRGAGEFTLAVARSLPRLEFEVFERRRDVDRPELCHVGARLVNNGALPSGLALPGSVEQAGGLLRLELEAGCELLVGRKQQRFDHVAGRGTSADFRWILTVPAGARITLRAQDRWSAPVTAEVRP